MAKLLSSDELRTLLLGLYDPNSKLKVSSPTVEGINGYWSAKNKESLKRRDVFMKGTIPKKDRVLDINLPIPIVGRFCEASASYVLKSMKIQCTPLDASEGQSMLAILREQTLNNWYSNYRIHQKFQDMVIQGTYLNEVGVMLEKDYTAEEGHENFNLKVLDYTYKIINKDSNDPYSRAKYVLRYIALSEDDLKIRLGVDTLKGIPLVSGLWSNSTTGHQHYFEEFYNETHKYLLYNREIVKVEEHNLPFLPFYKFVYFNNSISLLEALSPIAEMIQYLQSAQITSTRRQIEMGEVVVGNAKKIDLGDKSFINVESAGKVEIPAMPGAEMSISRNIESLMTMAYFISGISAEGMAGFTGALDTAGVSIELRMDSTVRKAVTVQTGLKYMIEDINRDYLKLMKKIYPTSNLAVLTRLGRVRVDDYDVTDLSDLVENKISFSPVSPRNPNQEENRLIAMVNNKMLPLEVALDRMGEDNPLLIKNKIEKEMARASLLNQAVQKGIKTKNEPLTPEEEIESLLANEDIEYNLPLTVNLPQEPYIEALDKAIASHPASFKLIDWRERRMQIKNAQIGKVNMQGGQTEDPQKLVKTQANNIAAPGQIPGKPSPQQLQRNPNTFR